MRGIPGQPYYNIIATAANVEIHWIAVPIELADGTTAVSRAEQVQIPEDAEPSRMGHHGVDVARGWTLHGDRAKGSRRAQAGTPDTPQQTEYHPSVHETVRILAETITHLTPVLADAEHTGLIASWFFIRKVPCWLVRFLPTDDTTARDATTVIHQRLDTLQEAGRIARWVETIYEPETDAFGGPAAMGPWDRASSALPRPGAAALIQLFGVAVAQVGAQGAHHGVESVVAAAGLYGGVVVEHPAVRGCGGRPGAAGGRPPPWP
ncbi:MAG: thiopeptide-type bacteriocin biosynthesis protein [Pseudonocardiaceae bacterium]